MDMTAARGALLSTTKTGKASGKNMRKEDLKPKRKSPFENHFLSLPFVSIVLRNGYGEVSRQARGQTGLLLCFLFVIRQIKTEVLLLQDR